MRAQQAGDPVESHDVVLVDLPQRGDEEVAHRVPVEGAPRHEAVLHDPAPHASPFAVVAECGQRHAQVARRQAAHLRAQTSG